MKRKILRYNIFLCIAVFITCMIVLSGSVGESLAKEPIKIGLIGSLSTPTGATNKASLEISIDEINKAGGILGRPVELITEDWKLQVPLAVAAYKKLVMSDKCLLIFTEGTEGSIACAQEGERLYPSYPHLMFAIWTADAGFTDLVANDYNKYKFLFRLHPRTEDFYDPDLKNLEFFTETIGTKKLALVIEDMGWSEVYRKGKPGVFPSLKEYFEKNGIKVVYDVVVDYKEKMYFPILEKVAASGADTIFWLTGYGDTNLMVKQWAQSAAKDIDSVFFSGICSYAAFWKMTGGQALGVTAGWPEIIIPFTKWTKPFLDKLKMKGAGLSVSAYGAYDGPWVLKEASEKAGSADDVEKLIKTIEGGKFQHAFWVWSFTKRHDTRKFPRFQGQFQENGRYVLVHPDYLVKITNPKDKYVRVKELRKRAEK